jgi:hypothetical protein
MAIESTAINDLIAGLQSKPLERDSQDWLFGERDDATEIDTRHEDNATSPFDRSPPVGSVPQPFGALPFAAQAFTMPQAFDYPLHRPSSPTSHVRVTDWSGIAKKLALPIGLFSIVIVLLGVYVAKSDEADGATPKPKVVAAAAAPEAKPVAAPALAPIEEANVEPPAVEAPQADVAKADETQVVVAVEVSAVEVPAVEAPKPEAATVEAPKVEAPKVEAPKVEAPVTVDPGSPASRFLATTAEPTIPTVAAKAAKAAPAPQTVANLPPAKPIAKTVAKPTKKSIAQARAEKRAAANRAAKASVAAAKARKKQVAAVDDEDEADQPTKPTKATGKGFLQISSTPAMDVWVDGRNSNAQTPVRIILLAGKHKVTLFDKDHAKAKSFEIEIKPDETTKVVKNYQ